MGAVTQTYVDPSIAGNSGSGTVGDPYGDLQYALNTMTRDATNGDQINIKAGTDEVLTAALSLTTYGTPSASAPLVLRGYTSAADDGGIGGISGGGSYGMFAVNTLDHIALIDLHMHNCGSADVVGLDQYIIVYNCEIDNTTGDGIDVFRSFVANNHVHNVGTNAIDIDYSVAVGNFVEYGTNVPAIGINLTGFSRAVGNIVKCSGSMDGIKVGSWSGATAYGNSVWSNAGTGQGIDIAGGPGLSAINNVVEGFSGVGGKGIQVASSADLAVIVGNAAYNNTTNYDTPSEFAISVNNDTLASSAFTDAANDDFSPSGTVTGFTEDAFPASFKGASTTNAAEKGAVQDGAGSGGGGTVNPLRGKLG